MKRTFLYGRHLELGAKFTEFGGWEMPLQYSSIIDEHNAVRSAAGVFDVSHMGTFIVSGKNAAAFLDKVCLGNISSLPEKKARYSMILNENGAIKDDVIVYNFGGEYMVVANAGNIEKDRKRLDEYKPDDVILEDFSGKICMLALQGAKAAEILQSLSETDVLSMKYFTVSELKLKDIDADFLRAARTGYTGEDGFEIFISNRGAQTLWDKLISLSVKPCGLGCRDTLRLEACMPLHGHEISEDINPIDAGFQKTINWDGDFIGKEALLPFKDNPKRKIIAFECLRGVARNGNKIFACGKEVGYVTSGAFSPTLKKPLGLALIDIKAADETKDGAGFFEVEIRGDKREIKVVNKPFYKKKQIAVRFAAKL
ncbi:MAG: glycine cleavage system aminomethyltransferase GcvT [Endomicrobium sp.]|jgi:aminomethyltransferase|nr:glycine cleavage system aminomethyltransferase GcvT [Endomicrobium sp.]